MLVTAARAASALSVGVLGLAHPCCALYARSQASTAASSEGSTPSATSCAIASAAALRRSPVAYSRSNSAAGLASSLRLAGTGTMEPPWWDQLGRIDVPTLVVWGEDDTKFATLGRRLAAGIGPHAETTSLAGVGHAAHLEAPDAVAALISGWFRRTHANR